MPYPLPRYLLDTSTVSAAIRPHDAILTRLEALEPAAWCISAIVRSELRYGLALRPEAIRLAARVNRFLAMSTTAPWDEDASDVHGDLRARLRQNGTPIGDMDEMIAAHALSLNATLVTDNTRHFERIPGLRLENWVR